MSAAFAGADHLVFFRSLPHCIMAATGGGRSEKGGESSASNVSDLLKKLNLMEDEGAVADFSDEEDGDEMLTVEWAIMGKVISPMAVHVNTVWAAMKPAWGNPPGLKFRAIGAKGDNLFVAEFSRQTDMERALAGAPWMVGRHAVVL